MEQTEEINATTTIKLSKYEIRRIRTGHPWIYSKSIAECPSSLKTGDVVNISGPRAEIIGTGIYNAESKINVRVLSDKFDTKIDKSFFEERIKEALNYRNKMLPNRKSFRLINSESDGLSGLIVDCYEDATLFQITSAGLEQRKADIVEALVSVLNPPILIERNDVSNRKFEGLDEMKKVHKDSGRTEQELCNFEINIEGIRYSLNLIEGNKTGLYLDQIDNHLKIRSILAKYPNAKVLDCFSYIGGFSLAAAGCDNVDSVIGIDQSGPCIEKAMDNARLNQTETKCQFIKANVFDWLRNASEDSIYNGTFDVVVLDPPSFTKNRHTVQGALRGYKELHVRAFKLLKKGGTLLTYSCSHHISEDLLRSIIFEAANDTKTSVVEVSSQRQSLDHPIVPSIPESFYLKGFEYLKR